MIYFWDTDELRETKDVTRTIRRDDVKIYATVRGTPDDALRVTSDHMYGVIFERHRRKRSRVAFGNSYMKGGVGYDLHPMRGRGQEL